MAARSAKGLERDILRAVRHGARTTTAIAKRVPGIGRDKVTAGIERLKKAHRLIAVKVPINVFEAPKKRAKKNPPHVKRRARGGAREGTAARRRARGGKKATARRSARKGRS